MFANKKELIRGLPLGKLSQILRGTINFTKRMGVCYLWIDLFYIIQDSADHWMAAAAIMSKVCMLRTLHNAEDPVASITSGVVQERIVH